MKTIKWQLIIYGNIVTRHYLLEGKIKYHKQYKENHLIDLFTLMDNYNKTNDLMKKYIDNSLKVMDLFLTEKRI